MITLDKPGSAVPDTGTDTGMNDGTGTLLLIGGVPARKVRGTVVRLAGRTRCVTIEPGYFGSTFVTFYERDGEAQRHAVPAEWESVRGSFLRYAVTNGIFAGIARMR